MTKLPLPPRRTPQPAKRFGDDEAFVYLKGVGVTTMSAMSADSKPLSAYVKSEAPGTLVGVRLQPNILARLDRARGGMTRPQKIREILEKLLP